MYQFFGIDDALGAILEARSSDHRMLLIPIPESTAKVLDEYVGWARSRKRKGRGKESYASSYNKLASALKDDCQKHLEDFARKCNDLRDAG